jgi:hypothetical protein
MLWACVTLGFFKQCILCTVFWLDVSVFIYKICRNTIRTGLFCKKVKRYWRQELVCRLYLKQFLLRYIYATHSPGLKWETASKKWEGMTQVSGVKTIDMGTLNRPLMQCFYLWRNVSRQRPHLYYGGESLKYCLAPSTADFPSQEGSAVYQF